MVISPLQPPPPTHHHLAYTRANVSVCACVYPFRIGRTNTRRKYTANSYYVGRNADKKKKKITSHRRPRTYIYMYMYSLLIYVRRRRYVYACTFHIYIYIHFYFYIQTSVLCMYILHVPHAACIHIYESIKKKNKKKRTNERTRTVARLISPRGCVCVIISPAREILGKP